MQKPQYASICERSCPRICVGNQEKHGKTNEHDMVKHKRHDNFCIATAIAARVDRLSTHESCLPDVEANET